VSKHKHIACYPGSFDPPTFGHLDVIERGRRLFDEVVVGVGQNPSKKTLFTAEERTDLLQQLIDDLIKKEPEHAPVRVQSFDGLTVDFARQSGATVLLRGVRNLSDLTSELQQAITNRAVAGIDTAFIGAGSDFGYTSSTLIRQITALADDLNMLQSMCPPCVIEALQHKRHANAATLMELRDASGA